MQKRFLGSIFGVLFYPINTIVSTMAVLIFGVSEAVKNSNRLILSMATSPQGLFCLVTALSLAGVCEEFVFRGFLQKTLSKHHPHVGLLVASLIFGLFHFDPQGSYIIATFLMGLMYGYIYRRYRNYVIPAAAHATLNLLILAVKLMMHL